MLTPLALAIVNTSNCPLLVRTHLDTSDPQQATKLIYLMHASLDIVDEKAEQPNSRDNFLGTLYQCEQYKIYAMMSTTKVKILLMIGQRMNFTQPREADVRQMLNNVHKVYVDTTTMNPFYKPNQPITSKRLDAYLDTIFAPAGGAEPAVPVATTTTTTPPAPLAPPSQLVQTV